MAMSVFRPLSLLLRSVTSSSLKHNHNSFQTNASVITLTSQAQLFPDTRFSHHSDKFFCLSHFISLSQEISKACLKNPFRWYLVKISYMEYLCIILIYHNSNTLSNWGSTRLLAISIVGFATSNDNIYCIIISWPLLRNWMLVYSIW